MSYTTIGNYSIPDYGTYSDVTFPTSPSPPTTKDPCDEISKCLIPLVKLLEQDANNSLKVEADDALVKYVHFRNNVTGLGASDGSIVGINESGEMIINCGTSGIDMFLLTNGGNFSFNTVSPATTVHISDTLPAITLTATTGTNEAYLDLINTAGSLLIGRESSVGGQLLTSSDAYSTIINSEGDYPIQLAVDDVILLSLYSDEIVQNRYTRYDVSEIGVYQPYSTYWRQTFLDLENGWYLNHAEDGFGHVDDTYLLLEYLGASPGTKEIFIGTYKEATGANDIAAIHLRAAAVYIEKNGTTTDLFSLMTSITSSGFRAARASTNQTLPSTTSTTVIFNSEDYDDNGDYDNSTGIFTAPATGYYSYAASVYISHNPGAQYWLHCSKNNTTNIREMSNAYPSAGVMTNVLAGEIKLTSGDTLRIKAYQVSGFDGAIIAGPETSFEVRRVY